MFFFYALLDTPASKEQLTKIYETYHQILLYAANDILKDPQLAEDAVQDAFLSLIRSPNLPGTPYSPQTRRFLLTVVKNKAIDIYRKRSHRQEDLIDDEFDVCSDEDILDQLLEKEGCEEIKKCIRKLSPMHRVLLEYRYLHELSEKEIAEILNLPPKRVNVAIYRARIKLQQLLRKQTENY